VRGRDQARGLSGRERPRQLSCASWQLELGRRVVLARAEKLEVAEERARCGRAARDRRRREPVGPELCRVALELFHRRRRERLAEKHAQAREVAAVRIDRVR
jgi:hypothetical protein